MSHTTPFPCRPLPRLQPALCGVATQLGTDDVAGLDVDQDVPEAGRLTVGVEILRQADEPVLPRGDSPRHHPDDHAACPSARFEAGLLRRDLHGLFLGDLPVVGAARARRDESGQQDESEQDDAPEGTVTKPAARRRLGRQPAVTRFWLASVDSQRRPSRSDSR
jgi:hypothetical protein